LRLLIATVLPKFLGSENMTATAGSVLGLANGGKTATANKPRGSRAKDRDKDGIAVLVGNPPPPVVPTDRDPPGEGAAPPL